MANKNTIIVVAGNKLRFDVDISGEPPPTVCWKKGDTVRACWQTVTFSHLKQRQEHISTCFHFRFSDKTLLKRLAVLVTSMFFELSLYQPTLTIETSTVNQFI